MERLKAAGLPVTRQNYIDLEYFGQPPEMWTAEHEEQLPPELQDWSKVP